MLVVVYNRTQTNQIIDTFPCQTYRQAVAIARSYLDTYRDPTHSIHWTYTSWHLARPDTANIIDPANCHIASDLEIRILPTTGGRHEPQMDPAIPA